MHDMAVDNRLGLIEIQSLTQFADQHIYDEGSTEKNL
jgi:hypothetical protein